MKRLILLLLLVVAIWYARQHYGDLFHKQPRDEAVIENTSGREMTHVRLTVDGQTMAKDAIAEDAKAVIPFHVDHDATFKLVWQWGDSPEERTWSGGNVYRGPMLQRHFLTVDGEGAVIYRAENK